MEINKQDERPWRKNLRNVLAQVDKLNRHYKETDVYQCNQFEEFTSKHKNDDWLEGYHRKLVKNELKIEEQDSLGPIAQQKILQIEAELDRKRELTRQLIAQQQLQNDENNEFWSSVVESPNSKTK